MYNGLKLEAKIFQLSSEKRESKIEKCEILPLGTVPSFPIQIASKALERAYSLYSIPRSSIHIPRHALNKTRNQYNAPTLLNYVNKEKQARYCLALITKDLYAANLNFVFGQALLGKSAILSLQRLKTDNKQLFRERIEKESVHEVGHVLGLSHCGNPNCVMRFSNTLNQVDKKEKKLCQDCQSKLNSPS